MTTRTRWLTILPLFAVASAAYLSAGPGQDPATAVTGAVTFAGQAPPPRLFAINKDMELCGHDDREILDVRVDAGGRLQGVVVYLDSTELDAAWDHPAEGYVLNQKGCAFEPYITIFPNSAGAKLKIVNSDPTLHNIHAYMVVGRAKPTLFNVGQPKGSKPSERPIEMRRGSHVVQIKCDAHDFMEAWLFVADNPYAALVGEDGTFSIRNPPPGRHTFKAWHPVLGTLSQEVEVVAGEPVRLDFEFTKAAEQRAAAPAPRLETPAPAPPRPTPRPLPPRPAPRRVAPAAEPEPEAPRAPREPAPLPEIEPQDPAQVDLGRHLFFEPRLSGDGGMSCATCHNPALGWSDAMALSDGYTGSLYFRRTRSILNTAHKRSLYWDGRISGSDLPTLVRDHISEAHFMAADGRLVLERLRQIPYYEETFKEVMGGEPSYGRILNAVSAFVRTIGSRNVPFDRFLGGDAEAIDDEAKRGYELFKGKASCIQCHDGPMLSDGRFHNLGVPANPAIFSEPLRHITFRRFFKTLGISDSHRLDRDLGLYAVTRRPGDAERFKTPTLREVSRTGPYMHNGALGSLEEVVEFYDRGGGGHPAKSSLLKPLGLTDEEKSSLTAFLRTLSGDEITVEVPEPLEYAVRPLGKKKVR